MISIRTRDVRYVEPVYRVPAELPSFRALLAQRLRAKITRKQETKTVDDSSFITYDSQGRPVRTYWPTLDLSQ